jgi:hypothetical protein
MNVTEQFINCREQFHSGKEKGKRMTARRSEGGEGMRKGRKENWGE